MHSFIRSIASNRPDLASTILEACHGRVSLEPADRNRLEQAAAVATRAAEAELVTVS